MTTRTATAKPEPRKRNGRAILVASPALLVLGLLVMHRTVLAALLGAVFVAVLVLVARARLARYRSGGRIAARKRRKHQGWAGPRELLRARYAAIRLTRRICPGAGLLDLGTSRRQPVAVCRENSALYVGPPGYWKTAALACHAADAPGLLFATSTKTDLLLATLPYREGPVWVLNADGYGGVPSTLAWSPVEGCEDPATAIRRAGDLMAASPRDPSGKDAYHEDRAAKLLRCALHAAAIDGASMHEVAAWVRQPLSPQFTDILRSPLACPGWDRQLAELLVSGRDGDWITGLVASASAALGWMDDPVMAAAACPRPGEGFRAREFARGHGSAYLVGKKRPYGSLAPYFAALGAEVFEQLKHYAMEAPSGRLPVPATFVLDEMPLTCPLPLHDMLAEARGPLVTFIAAAQTLAQLRAKFGQEDGDTIRSACPVEVFTGGEKRIDDLEAVSKVIGDHDTWHGSYGDLRTEQLLPPGALRLLRKGRAVILMPECRPVLASLPAIWKRPGHRAATLAHPALRPAPVTVLEVPRREPIAPPYTPPAIAAEGVPACRT